MFFAGEIEGGISSLQTVQEELSGGDGSEQPKKKPRRPRKSSLIAHLYYFLMVHAAISQFHC